MKKQNNNLLIMIIVAIVIMIVLAIVLIVVKINLSNKQKSLNIDAIKSYTSISDFKSIEEVCIYLDCKYIKQEDSNQESFKKDIYMNIKLEPYSENNSNEAFYNKLIGYSAEVLGYTNFRIIDKEKNLELQVFCDKTNKQVTKYTINGETNYFKKRNSINELKNSSDEKQIDVTINSKILNSLINNDWFITESEIGSKDSVFDSYDIFFDEGVEVKKVNGKIYNIVFTEKYNDSVINNLKTTSLKNDVIKALGEPIYTDNYTKISGYKSKDIYVLYSENEKQISIYPVIKEFETDKFSEHINSYINGGNISELIKVLKNDWTDYDEYIETENSALLKYTSKGVVISYNNTLYENGVTLYNNFKGKVSSDITYAQLKNGEKELPNKIHIKNKNSVANEEINKLQIYYGKISKFGPVPDKFESSKFTIYAKQNEDSEYLLQIISLDKTSPNSELKEYVNSYMWIDDYNIAYGIENEGIYIYNAKNRQYGTIVTGKNESFNITEYKDGILKYDDKTVKIKNN